MGRHCSIYDCNEKDIKGGNLSFHKLPKDESIRKIWENKIRRKSLKPTEFVYVCSKHFTPESFNTSKLGGTWLKKDAVPTIFEHTNDSSQKSFKIPTDINLKIEESIVIEEDSPTEHDTDQETKVVPTVFELTNNSPEKSCKSQTKRKFGNEENNDIFEDLPIKNDPDQPSKKKFRFMGDFEENDMDSPTKARKFYQIASNAVKKKNMQLKALRHSKSLLEKRVASPEHVLQDLKEEK